MLLFYASMYSWLTGVIVAGLLSVYRVDNINEVFSLCTQMVLAAMMMYWQERKAGREEDGTLVMMTWNSRLTLTLVPQQEEAVGRTGILCRPPRARARHRCGVTTPSCQSIISWQDHSKQLQG